MNTTQKLAEALRGLLDRDNGQDSDTLAATWDNARTALAEYEASVARPATVAGEHTAGPWINDGDAVSALVDPENTTTYAAPVCYMDEDWTAEIQAANARRIVACVNACEGPSTADLESGNYCIVRTRHEYTAPLTTTQPES